MNSMILKPRMSEKAYQSSIDDGVYTFEVPLSANKLSIARNVSEQFEVNVVSVKTLRQNGKPKKSYRKKQRPIDGKRADKKIAFVRLAEGDSIKLYGNIEDQVSDDNKGEDK